MADAATLIVLVAAGDAADATTRAMAKATHEALGPAAHVIVRETAGDPGDADVAAVERSENPDAVVELSWIGTREARHRQASVRVHLRTGRWVDRWITFRHTDADAERGRTVGFAIASILPEENGGSGPPAPPSAPPAASPAPSTTGTGGGNAATPSTPEAPVPSPEPTPTPESTPSGAATPPAPSATTAPPSPPAPMVPPPAERPVHPESPNASQEEHAPTFTADILAIGFWDPGTAGFGGRASAEYFALPMLSVHAGGSLRGGSIPIGEENLSYTIWSAFAGVAYYPVRPRLKERFGVSIRGAWVVDFATVSEPRNLGVGSGPLKLNYGPELAVEAAVLIVPDVEALVGGGAEYMLRPSHIAVADQNQGRPRQWMQGRPFGEAGFRLRF